MIPIYAVAVALGFVGVLGWVTLGLAAASLEGKANIDPETRFGLTGRYVVGGTLGFGMGGISASYGGWPSGAAVAAAIGGAVIAIAAAQFVGVGDESDEDRAEDAA